MKDNQLILTPITHRESSLTYNKKKYEINNNNGKLSSLRTYSSLSKLSKLSPIII